MRRKYFATTAAKNCRNLNNIIHIIVKFVSSSQVGLVTCLTCPNSIFKLMGRKLNEKLTQIKVAF